MSMIKNKMMSTIINIWPKENKKSNMKEWNWLKNSKCKNKEQMNYRTLLVTINYIFFRNFIVINLNGFRIISST